MSAAVNMDPLDRGYLYDAEFEYCVAAGIISGAQLDSEAEDLTRSMHITERRNSKGYIIYDEDVAERYLAARCPERTPAQIHEWHTEYMRSQITTCNK